MAPAQLEYEHGVRSLQELRRPATKQSGRDSGSLAFATSERERPGCFLFLRDASETKQDYCRSLAGSIYAWIFERQADQDWFYPPL